MDEYLPEAVIPRDKLKFVSGDIIYNETNVKVGTRASGLPTLHILQNPQGVGS